VGMCFRIVKFYAGKVVEPDKLDTGKCQKEGHCED
jgi:hypothetical protein